MPIAVKIAVVTACALVAVGTILWVMRRNSKARLAIAGQEGRPKGTPHHMSKKSSGSVEVLSNPAPGPRLTPTAPNKQKALAPMTGEVTEGDAPLDEGKKPGFWMRTGSGAASSKPVASPPSRVERPREPTPAPTASPEPIEEQVVLDPTPVAASVPVASGSLAATAAPNEPVPSSLSVTSSAARPNSLAADATETSLAAAASVKPTPASLAWSLGADATTNNPITRDNRFSAPSVASLTQPLAEESPPSTNKPKPPVSPLEETTPKIAFPAALAATPMQISPSPALATVEPIADPTSPDLTTNSPIVEESLEPDVDAANESEAALDGLGPKGPDSPNIEDRRTDEIEIHDSAKIANSDDTFVFYDDDDDDDEDTESAAGPDDEIDFREDVIRIHVRIDENGVQQITTMDMSSGAQQWTDKEIKKSNGSKGKKKKKKGKKK